MSLRPAAGLESGHCCCVLGAKIGYRQGLVTRYLVAHVTRYWEVRRALADCRR